MTELRWPRDSTFADRETGNKYQGEGVYDVPDGRVEAFLDRGWERIETPDGDVHSDDDDEETEEEGATLDTARSDDELGEILDGTVGDVEDAAADIDEKTDLERLRDLEEEGDDRTTALGAIDERLDELHGD